MQLLQLVWDRSSSDAASPVWSRRWTDDVWYKSTTVPPLATSPRPAGPCLTAARRAGVGRSAGLSRRISASRHRPPRQPLIAGCRTVRAERRAGDAWCSRAIIYQARRDVLTGVGRHAVVGGSACCTTVLPTSTASAETDSSSFALMLSLLLLLLLVPMMPMSTPAPAADTTFGFV